MIEIISPHIDDAAFSLANYIQQQIKEHQPLRIINCFSISDYHVGTEKLDLQQVTNIRKSEDNAFRGFLDNKIEFIYLDLNDAPIRGYAKCTFDGTFRPDDQLQIEKLYNYFIKGENSTQFIAPLGLGDHIDHIICNSAICKLDPNSIRAFYEDLPYAGRMSESEIIVKVKLIEARLRIRLQPVIVGKAFVDSKEDICRLYKTQIKDWYIEKIRHHLMRLQGGERLWVKKIQAE
jgi:hypothetical protein